MDILMQNLNNYLLLLKNMPSFLAWWGSGLLLILIFISIYLWITPYREMQLIRQNNISAALHLGGVILGYALPVASCIEHGVNWVDFVLWGIVAMLAQVFIYGVVRVIFRDWVYQLENDNRAMALLVATIHITAGYLNAAALTY